MKTRDHLSHRERLQMIMAGERPDRYAGSCWRHFFHKEHYAAGTIDAMLDFQEEFDWDFMKINPRADYHIEGWGFKQRWSYNEFKKHDKLFFPVKNIADWHSIRPLSLETPALAEHLKVIAGLRRQSKPDLPILMTVFSPLAIAGRMIENKQALVEQLRSDPETIHRALRAITDTFARFANEARNAGADGLFFATLQWASSDMITWEEYREFGVPYDIEVLKACESDAINLLHVCASNNYMKELVTIDDYNVRLYNWDSTDSSNLSLDDAMELPKGKTFVGGIEQDNWLRKADYKEICRKIDEMKKSYDSARLIIGPGCVVPPEVPGENLRAIRERL